MLNGSETQSGPKSSILRISDGFSAEFLGSFSHSQKFHRVRVRRSRDGGPEIRALIAAAVPWLARAMAAETRLLIGHTSLSAAAAAVRTPMIAHALVLQQAPLEGRLALPARAWGPARVQRAAVVCLEFHAQPALIYLRPLRLQC